MTIGSLIRKWVVCFGCRFASDGTGYKITRPRLPAIVFALASEVWLLRISSIVYYSKRFSIKISFGDEAVDSGIKVDAPREDAVSQSPSRDLGEETLDRVEPGDQRRREAVGPSRMSASHSQTLSV